LFVREEGEYKKFKEINSRHQKGWLKTVWYNSLFFPIAELLSSIALATVIWWGGLNVVLKDTASVGELTAFIMMVPMMFRPLNQIANKFNTLQMGMVAADRVFKVLDTNSSVQNEGLQKLQQWKGCIKFKEVYFSYIPNELVVKGMSFTANAGQTVAIVGSTGAGKSTIISLLSRFYEINSGQITIDGIDISDFNLRDLRQNMAVVSQDVFLFSDTIYHNITLKNKNITLAQVVAAAKAIGVHDFIESLPQSYAFNVKERGAMLSTGQRQLIAFLRAYVRNPKILILDEATASLDTHSEQLIQEATKAITAGRTSIVIAHRLATVKNANKIIVVESGQIVETGTHNDLLKMSDGYYKKLYESQFLQKYPENS
jgi:subfamily B ATP-binding cassette protein MsbA